MTLQRVGFELGSKAETEWREGLARAIASTHGTVCKICGLDAYGHGPKTEWLGYAPHDYAPQQATSAQLEQADALTVAAYRARDAKG